MIFEITTQQGKTYQVSDDKVWVWIELERDTGLTMREAAEKMASGSLDILTQMLFKLSTRGGHTELKSHKAWVEHEFDEFDVVDDADPKATEKEVSEDN